MPCAMPTSDHARRLTLTDKGTAVLERVYRQLQQLKVRTLADLSETERGQMLRSLKHLINCHFSGIHGRFVREIGLKKRVGQTKLVLSRVLTHQLRTIQQPARSEWPVGGLQQLSSQPGVVGWSVG